MMITHVVTNDEENLLHGRYGDKMITSFTVLLLVLFVHVDDSRLLWFVYIRSDS